uniref:Small ribosomal subunit protein uS15 n=1 Tax=Prolemur simus TaxID=1328070 RepID=A0A8C8ZU13_PROSS
MGRMRARGQGLSQLALPYRHSVPTWLKLTSGDVKEQIYKLAKKGLTPSQTGVIVRDSQGIAQVHFVTGNKISRILSLNMECRARGTSGVGFPAEIAV